MRTQKEDKKYVFLFHLPSFFAVASRMCHMVLDQVALNWRSLFKKTGNFLLVWFQKRILRPARVLGYPYYLTLDPGNVCDVNCPLCPTGLRKPGRSRGFMSFENFRKIIDCLAPYLFVLDLFKWGEPFLNRDIFDMIRYARRKGILVRVSSNLNSFQDGMALKLAQAKCDILLVSLYGASRESCHRYQTGTDFDRVIRTMRAIRRERRRQPLITWRFLVHRFNEHEINMARAVAKGTADVLEFKQLHCDMSEELFWDNRTQYENIRPWLPRDGRWSRYHHERQSKKRVRAFSCSYLYSTTVINWNGSVSPCCSAWYEKYDFGNVFQDGFEAVWNNERFRASRRLIFRGENNGTKTICGICKENKALL
jgi:radical SAM protein with 4Fe4S-binding SPASM domain